jgi:hypothetical protein
MSLWMRLAYLLREVGEKHRLAKASVELLPEKAANDDNF